MKSSLVSIIIPIYNGEKYLRRCLDSVYNQTYVNIEVLLIDDGSTDNSGKIADEFEKRDNRFKVFHIANSGAANARNFALDKYNGEYVTFIDSDDFVDEHYVERLLCAVEECNVFHAICLPYNSRDGIISFDIERKEIVKINVKRDFNYTKTYAYGNIWGSLYHKNLIGNTRFDNRYYVGEDEVFFAEILLKSENVAIVQEQLYVYMLYEDSASHGRYDEKKKTDIYAWQKIQSLFENETFEFQANVKAKCCCIYLEHLKKMKKTNYYDTEWNIFVLAEARKNLKDLLRSSFHWSIKLSAVLYCISPNFYGKIHSIIR